MRDTIYDVLKKNPIGSRVGISGWVRTFRNDQFIALNDGSCIDNLQVVVHADLNIDDTFKRLQTGAAIHAEGTLKESLGKGQSIELICDKLTVLGDCSPDEYPIQMKRHSLEFLREKAHLRFRTNTFAAVFRIRHHLAYAIHSFFNERGF
ncbi:MAG: OB-fold nucleic acid binding domain-containing protein, partial [Flavobacteriales bacterium]